MMIGGYDKVFKAVGDAALLKSCSRVLQAYWPDVRFEDVIKGTKFLKVEEIPFSKTKELFAYPDAKAEAEWEIDMPLIENLMVYLIVNDDELTVVVDNPYTPEMSSMLKAIEAICEHSLLREGTIAPPKPTPISIAQRRDERSRATILESQRLAVEKAFSEFDFGNNVITQVGDWRGDAHEWLRDVYFDRGDMQPKRVVFAANLTPKGTYKTKIHWD